MFSACGWGVRGVGVSEALGGVWSDFSNSVAGERKKVGGVFFGGLVAGVLMVAWDVSGVVAGRRSAARP